MINDNNADAIHSDNEGDVDSHNHRGCDVSGAIDRYDYVEKIYCNNEYDYNGFTDNMNEQ